jgi:midasin (ATPase involved in ribosome maturation)
MPLPPQVFKSLHETVKMTEQMMKNAESNQWETVIKLEKQRQQMIEDLFNNHEEKDRTQHFNQLLQTLIDLNQKLANLGESHVKNLGGELKAVQKGRQATRAYRDIVKLKRKRE